jgi:hypothetical protein
MEIFTENWSRQKPAPRGRVFLLGVTMGAALGGSAGAAAEILCSI